MDKFIGWLIEHTEKWWMWVIVIGTTTVLVHSGMPLLIGVGVGIYGLWCYAYGTKVTVDYYIKKLNKEKEKTNDVPE